MATNLKLVTLNDVKLTGRLARDPDIRFTTQGTAVARITLAVGRRYRDKTSGDWKEEVAWVPCTVWREAAERAGKRLKKGSPVFVEGRLKTKQWQTKEGQKRSDLEVEVLRMQFLEALGEGGVDAGESGASESSAGYATQPAGVSGESLGGGQSDDEVPF